MLRAKAADVTRRAIYLIGRPTLYTIAKARTELGWTPGIEDRRRRSRTFQWYTASAGKLGTVTMKTA